MNKQQESNFIVELEEYVRKGIPIRLDGVLSTPLQILETCFRNGNYFYMRDYIGDEKGIVRELHFDRVSLVSLYDEEIKKISNYI